jgi:hypothetical protein
MNGQLPQLPITVNRDVTLCEYIRIRDATWRRLKDPKELNISSLELLTLTNDVVKKLLNSRPESLERFLERMQCEACELFILRSRRELRAENRQSPPIDLNEAAAALRSLLPEHSEKPLLGPEENL